MRLWDRTDSRQVLTWAAIFTVSNIVVKGMQALLVVALATAIPPESFAQFGILYALYGAAASFGIVGLQEIAASRLKKHGSELRRNVLFQRVSGLAYVSGLIGLLIIVPFIVSALMRSIPTSAVVAAVLLGALTSYEVLQANLQRIGHRNAASLVSSAGIPLCSVIGLAVGGWIARDIVYIFILGLLGSSIVLYFQIVNKQVFLPVIPRVTRAIVEIINIFPFLLIAVLGWLSGYGINFVISASLDNVDVAAFTLLFTVASVSQLIANSINMAWAPRFYSYYNSGSVDFAETRSRFFSTLLVIVLAVGGCIAVGLLPWLAYLVGGNLAHYGSYQTELAWLMAGYVASAPWWQGQNYFHISGKSHALMRLTFWSGGLGMVLWVLAILIIGRDGIYIGFFVQMCLKATAMWIMSSRYWGMRPPIFTMLFFLPLIFAGLLFPSP